MKTRTGFVSNSSSSSFIAYAAVLGDMNQVYNLLDEYSPGKLFDTYADKLYKQNKKYETTLEPYEADDERFKEAMIESLNDGYPVDMHDATTLVKFPLEFENLYDDNGIVVGKMVDTDELFGVEKVYGGTFSSKDITHVNEVLASVDLVADLIIGERQC